MSSPIFASFFFLYSCSLFNMGIKKLFSSSSKEAKYNPRRESTMSSISSSIGKWAQPQKRRTIPTVTTDSHPQNSSDHTITSSPESMSSFEQEEEKIQLPVTPSPSDEEEDNKREGNFLTRKDSKTDIYFSR